MGFLRERLEEERGRAARLEIQVDEVRGVVRARRPRDWEESGHGRVVRPRE